MLGLILQSVFMTTKIRTGQLKGLSKANSFKFSPEVALELEVYGMVQKYGNRKEIIEESLTQFFKCNPMPKKLREAALLILEQGGE